MSAKSNKAKGAHHEKKVADYLIAHGYAVARGFKKAAFIQGRIIPITYDLFGAYDIVALLDPELSTMSDLPRERFVQVTAGGHVNDRRKKCFAVWRKGEVWEHIRAGHYCIHRHGGSQSMVDVNVLLKPKVVADELQ